MRQVNEYLYEIGCKFLPTDLSKAPSVIDQVQMGVTHAHRDQAVIQSYLDQGKGLGVAGGEIFEGDYLVILDLDVKGKDRGPETLVSLEEKYGELPATFTVVTPSGGRHLYFHTDAALASRNALFPGIDVKGVNGYVCCPPTEGYTVDSDEAVAELPVEWKLMLQAVLTPRSTTLKQTYSMLPMDREKEVCWFNQQVPIREMLKSFGYKQIRQSGFQHPDGSTSPCNVTVIPNANFLRNGSDDVSFHFGAHDVVQGGPHDSFDLLRLRKFGGNVDEAVQYVREMMVQQRLKTFPGGHLNDVMARQEDFRQLEIVDDHLCLQDLAFAAGQSQTLKTFWAIDMACSMATGVPFLGHYLVRQGQSLLILTESRKDYLNRVVAWAKHNAKRHNRNLDELLRLVHENVIVYFDAVVFSNKDHAAQFEQLMRAYDPDFRPQLVVIDTYSNNTTHEENDNNGAAQFLAVVRAKARQDNCAILFIHHPSKAEALLRGASANFNNVPVVFEFKNMTDPEASGPVHIGVTYAKYANDVTPAKYTFSYESYDLFHDDSYLRPRMRTGIGLQLAELPIVPAERVKLWSESEPEQTLGDPEPRRGGNQSEWPDRLRELFATTKYPMSVNEIAHLLKTAASNIRRHLNRMAEDGEIAEHKIKGNKTVRYTKMP